MTEKYRRRNGLPKAILERAKVPGSRGRWSCRRAGPSEEDLAHRLDNINIPQYSLGISIPPRCNQSLTLSSSFFKNFATGP